MNDGKAQSERGGKAAGPSRDMTGAFFVVVYLLAAVFGVCAWNYLSDQADALTSDARRLNQQELSDTAFSLGPAAIDAENSNGFAQKARTPARRGPPVAPQ